MDIRTKLVVAFVAVSLASMAALGAFAYEAMATQLERITLRQLNALAESKKRDLRKVIEGWVDQVNLIASRTQLRVSLARYVENGSEEDLAQMRRILIDALTSGAEVRRMTLFDASGRDVLTVGRSDVGPAQFVSPPPEGPVMVEAHPRAEEGTAVTFHVPLALEGTVIGALNIVLAADELQSVASNYTGLGETGEVLVAMVDPDGQTRLLTRLRHEEDAEALAAAVRAPDVQAALRGEERTFRDEENVDYRGQPVWSASRYLPEVSWGIVVKVDEAEERAPVLELRAMLLDLGLALSAFAVLAGTLLGIYLARPIRELAELVQRIRGGETHLRADVAAEDEVAYLGRALNELMDDLSRHDAEHRPPWTHP